MGIHLCFVTPESLRGIDWLTPHETFVFQRIRAATHREDWLAGRLAAKKLIQQYLLERAGLELALSQIEIINDEHGTPCLNLKHLGVGEEYGISLAHSAGYGLAGLSLHGPIGVDLQQIRPVRPDLAERVLTEHERAQLTDRFAEHELEGVLVFWALKEAAIKAQRMRPAPTLREIVVTLTEPGCAEICMRSQKLTAQWGHWREFIWAWALAHELDYSHTVPALVWRS